MHYFKAITNRINSFVHMLYIKILHFNSFEFSMYSNISNSCHFSINDYGKIRIGKGVGARRYCEFSVSENGKIDIGDNTFFNNNCMIVSHEKIVIGNGTKLGPSVKIYDHDYDYKDFEAFQRGKHNSKSVIIGNNCWIGAGTIILKGTELGDGCVVGAGSILKGKYESNKLIVQKRIENVFEKIRIDE